MTSVFGSPEMMRRCHTDTIQRMGAGERCIPGVLTSKINKMNNDNDANDNGEDLHASLAERERQELLRPRREAAAEIQLLRQERDRLLLERRQRQRLLDEQAETRRIWAEDAENRLARMVRVARRQEPPQRQAFGAHVLERERQQQAESVEEGKEEDPDAVSQRQPCETHVLERQEQQEAELVEESRLDEPETLPAR